MPRASWVGDEFYGFGERLRDACLRNDGSLFTPTRQIWTAEAAAEWDASISVMDTSERSFGQKLADQLAGLSREAVQFASESLFVALLTEADTKGDTKRSHIANALGVLTEPVEIPQDLAALLDKGIATYGQGGRNKRDAHLRYLASYVTELKKIPVEEREATLRDPHRFRTFAHAVPQRSGQMQRDALLHLLFPDEFEPIVSLRVKQRIVDRFSDLVIDADGDPDRKLAEIRAALSDTYGEGFSFYDDPVRAEWEAVANGLFRAWLVRGERAYGTNLIPRWLEEGFVSMGSPDEGEIRKGMTVKEIIDTVQRNRHPDKSRQELSGGALSGRHFATDMEPGHLVLTRDAQSVYVGRILSEQQWHPDGEPGTARRRDIEWLNGEAPLTWAELPDSLRKRASNPNTVWDLKDQAQVLASLIGLDGSAGWEQFLYWCERLLESLDFDSVEREYKLRIAERVGEARRLVEAGDPEWITALRQAFGRENNLTNFHEHGPFLDWCAESPEEARSLLVEFWAHPSAAMRGALFRLPTPVVPGRAARTSLASFLLLGIEPTEFPFFRMTVYENASRLVSPKVVAPGATVEDLYEDFVALLDEVRARVGDEVRDRLDAQGLVWWITSGDPPDEWNDDEKARFLAYQGRPKEGKRDHLDETPLARLARELTMDEEDLARIVRLLERKRQIVFYGPPGTGKTFVARKLARHLAGSAERVRLVQFHASYAYEDFVEGFRPSIEQGQPGFRLHDGPLLKIARQADADRGHSYVLVIDEVNRGNVAKVFGELYFLLEYRDEEVELQYSAKPFRLPENLLIIATMNTADRTIALVDAALRRRFYFVPFFPGRPPVNDLLRRWLKNRKPDLVWLADVVEAANRELRDEHVAIGHSHFLVDDLDEERVRELWEHAILPTVEEHFFGQRERVEAFALERLRGSEAPAESPAGETDANDASS